MDNVWIPQVIQYTSSTIQNRIVAIHHVNQVDEIPNHDQITVIAIIRVNNAMVNSNYAQVLATLFNAVTCNIYFSLCLYAHFIIDVVVTEYNVVDDSDIVSNMHNKTNAQVH